MIRVPWLSYEDVRGIADRFLAQHHPAGTIPVPMDEIVEFGLGINIIPLPGLRDDHGIDGFLSMDMTEISVDAYVFEKRHARYRFTLGHESAHLVLHGDILRAVAPTSVDDWKKFVRNLPERDRASLEWQAYAFAGLVLVPREPLALAYRDAMRQADEIGIDPKSVPDVTRQYVTTFIGRAFEVSGEVVDKRLTYDGI